MQFLLFLYSSNYNVTIYMPLTCRDWQVGAKFLPFNGICSQLADIFVIHTNKHILRLDVCVDDLTLSVEVIQTL